MPGHYINKCVHGKVKGQCRCPGPKPTTIVPCNCEETEMKQNLQGHIHTGSAVNRAPATPKYLVFKYEDIEKMASQYGLQPEDNVAKIILDMVVDDAVVIRRQDVFAGPALNSYACGIALVASLADDGPVRTRLKDIADYFHQQAVLADEAAASGTAKIPD